MAYADKRIEIRDFRNGNWYWANKQVLEDRQLKKADKLVYSAIASFANEQQSAFPSISSIEKRATCGRPTVIQSIKALEKYKYIAVERLPGKVNRYTLLKLVKKLNQLRNLTSPTSKKQILHQLKTDTGSTPRLVKNRHSNKKRKYNKKEITPSVSGIKILRETIKTLGLKQ